MRVCVLGSGSKGNCTLVSEGGTHVLVDCGLSARRTVAALRSFGVDPHSLAAILVSHEHADHVCGLRTFLRRFQEATGSSPGDWLISERVEAAKGLLSSDDLAIEAVAAAVGFGSAHALRHHFRRKVGLTPTEYRSRFLKVERRG